jgi:hypothetical protein
MNSLFRNPPNLDSSRGFSGLRVSRFDIGIFAYSAAVTNVGFLLVAEIMKSLMRGTISERKREPLNTP